MLIKYFKRLLITNRDMILQKVLEVKGLMSLLMKYRDSGQRWTNAEKKEIMKHLKSLSRVIPALIIFMLPAGSLLLPVLADALDRRKTKRA